MRASDIWRCCQALEDVLAPFTPRPHLGKVFAMPPAIVRQVYGGEEAVARFVEVQRRIGGEVFKVDFFDTFWALAAKDRGVPTTRQLQDLHGCVGEAAFKSRI